jgi:UDP-glucose 4-epimerase
MKSVLLCGGAGYIGSHMAKALAGLGYLVTVLDNLSTGHREAVQWGSFVEADLADNEALNDVFGANRFDAVMHFCAHSLVGESVMHPYKYYANNVGGTLNLLQAMQQHGVERIVFSSTAAVYGNPASLLIDEDHAKVPINPYGMSKLMVERVLADAASAYGLRSVALRYFNAAGASPTAEIGEAHLPETHLIPNVLKAVLSQGPGLKVFGDDYPTQDGTCVRDYVHVEDLVLAHELALGYMDAYEGAHAFNLGSGQGFSVREVIAVVEEVTGQSVPYELTTRRAGDPAVLVASNARAKAELGWQPLFNELRPIIESAWQWHRNPKF